MQLTTAKQTRYTEKGQSLPATLEASNGGQVGIIVILVGVVIFTLGMFTAARVTTDLRGAARTEESTRALGAAEAGFEMALRVDFLPVPAVSEGDWDDTGDSTQWNDGVGSAFAHWTATPRPNTAGPVEDTDYLLGDIEQGDVETIWLTFGNNSDLADMTSAPAFRDPFRIRWFNSSGGGPVDVEIITFYRKNSGEVSVNRKFPVHNTDPNGYRIHPASDPEFDDYERTLFVRIKPITRGIFDVRVGGWGSGHFPTQHYDLESVGWAEDDNPTMEVARRKLVGTKDIGNIPAFFDYVIYSGSDLEKTN